MMVPGQPKPVMMFPEISGAGQPQPGMMFPDIMGDSQQQPGMMAPQPGTDIMGADQ